MCVGKGPVLPHILLSSQVIQHLCTFHHLHSYLPPFVIFLFLFPLDSTGEHHECPIRIQPEALVLQYMGESQDATCMFTSTRNARTIAWLGGPVLHHNETTWTPDTHTDWDPSPRCTVFFQRHIICQKPLNFTLYSVYIFIF